MNRSISIRELLHISLFVTVTAVCAQIAIPMPGGVPMTLQTWAISLAGIVLGAKNGTLATLVYVLLGAVGAPVFAGFSGGLGIIAGPTGGFILSFPLMALTAGIGEGKGSVSRLVCGLIAGTVINFAAGMLYFSLITTAGLQTAFAVAVLPFIPSAVLRIILLPAIGRSIKFALAKNNIILDKRV